MESNFYKGNREKLYATLPNGTMLVTFSGKEVIKTANEFYPFYANRNFVYLTGLDRKEFILAAFKDKDKVEEKIFIQPKNMMVERWTGTRLSPEEVSEKSGIAMKDILYTEAFTDFFERKYGAGKIKTLACDLYKNASTDRDSEDVIFARRIKRSNPAIEIIDIMPQLRRQRVIKQPCEIEAMRKAALATKDAIVAMMKASKPGMYEYEYRAEYDYALAKKWGMLEPGFPPIISCGNNNFCIHYYGSDGQAKDGDMILNDVGARYDFMGTDVSRGFPCNGKFSEKQRQLYTAAYNTSEYLFSIIKPGMPMHRVDEIAKEYCCEELKKIGLLKDFSEIGKYMWHGGAHHVGFDTHDLVEAETIQAGMMFCVDIGIYVEEWGIGFRVEDNCLVTEDGCENLTYMVPRAIEEIEAVMAEGKAERGE
ncbi:MAG: aminopeptidase P N-terminal domain-containing protein [Oscillospiraceae bacterium]|nr:aminopeptidase P N-terminal domain-containing protein [Oscillospiraceae bacterium]